MRIEQNFRSYIIEKAVNSTYGNFEYMQTTRIDTYGVEYIQIRIVINDDKELHFSIDTFDVLTTGIEVGIANMVIDLYNKENR